MDPASVTAPDPAQPEQRGRLSSLRLLWPFARPYRGLLVLTFGAALLATLAQLTIPLVTRAVVDWCRRAAVDHPESSVGGAVLAALAVGQRLPDVPPAPLILAAAPPGTVPLRRRVATLMGSRVEEAI